MQTLKRITHLVWKVLLLESALLIIVAVFWRWTSWQTTADYGTALATTGGIIIVSGVLGLARRQSSVDMRLREAKRIINGSEAQGQQSSTSTYAESTRVWFWLLSLGIITVGIGTLLEIFSLI